MSEVMDLRKTVMSLSSVKKVKVSFVMLYTCYFISSDKSSGKKKEVRFHENTQPLIFGVRGVFDVDYRHWVPS